MDKSKRHIVIGQPVTERKRIASKAMRRAMTPAEEVLWRRIRRNELNGLHFRRQQIIDGFIVDFYCHEKALVVEVDGGYHQPDADRERDAILSARRLKMPRFSNEQVLHNLEGVIAEIIKIATEAT